MSSGKLIAKVAPKAVAIPRPPLNPENMDQLCPAIPASPEAASIPMPSPRIFSEASSTGNVPLIKTSKGATGTTHHAPTCDARLEAQLFFDPSSLISTFLASRPIRYEVGMEPTR